MVRGPARRARARFETRGGARGARGPGRAAGSPPGGASRGLVGRRAAVARARRRRGIVVLDEIHRLPEVFPLLRVLSDRRPLPARFLVLGSASPSLLRQSSESLAGRIAFHELAGFDLSEVDDTERLWLRGGFPRSALARTHAESLRWRVDFTRTFLERDLSSLGVAMAPASLRRFWEMLAHGHGRVWNGAEFARAFGVSQPTVRRYLDLLASLYLVRQLKPWHENIAKRQVRSPKVYVRDSGLLHALLRLEGRREVTCHPVVGASFEGFVIEQVASLLQLRGDECFFWATHGGAELDLLVHRRGRRIGFEVKRREAPSLTPSMRSAIETLHLHRLYVVHAGTKRFALGPNVLAVPVTGLRDELLGTRPRATRGNRWGA